MSQLDFNTKHQNEVIDVQSWEDLFRLTIEIAKKEIHCSTLAYYNGIVEPYNSTKGYGIAKFKPLPITSNQESYEIQAYFFNEESEFETKKIYCIIFTDYNFKTSVELGEQRKTTDQSIHSLSFGVVLDVK